jgi:ABC-type anion transport system duplicated permease subunit
LGNEETMNDLQSYGVLGIVVIALAAYVLMIEKRHSSERKEWKDTIEKQFDVVNRAADEANKATREHTSVLSSLKTIIETMRR